jgi:hypothetical protein
MNFDYVKKNKAAVVVATIAILVSGAVIFAQMDNNPNNDITAALSKKVTLPPGSAINGTLDTTVSSASSNVGDVVSASINSPIIIEGTSSIPAGSKLIGRVSSLERANNASQGSISPGALALDFDKIQIPNGSQIPISASVGVQRGVVSNKTTAYTTGNTGRSNLAMGVKDTVIGAGAGALFGTAVGAIAGGMPGRGAWSGAAIGGGLGATKGIYSAVKNKGTTTYSTKTVGEDVTLRSGTNVTAVLNQPMKVAANILP